MGTFVKFVLVAAATMALYLGGRWYYYVEYGSDPHDAQGVALNSYAPAQLKTWACGRLAQRFPTRAPPLGCDRPASRTAEVRP
jgi:hypothetical protein